MGSLVAIAAEQSISAKSPGEWGFGDLGGSIRLLASSLSIIVPQVFLLLSRSLIILLAWKLARVTSEGCQSTRPRRQPWEAEKVFKPVYSL